MPLDLAFGKAFELSHNMKNRSVHFSGYHTCIGDKYHSFDNYSDSLGFQLSLWLRFQILTFYEVFHFARFQTRSNQNKIYALHNFLVCIFCLPQTVHFMNLFVDCCVKIVASAFVY